MMPVMSQSMIGDKPAVVSDRGAGRVAPGICGRGGPKPLPEVRRGGWVFQSAVTVSRVFFEVA